MGEIVLRTLRYGSTGGVVIGGVAVNTVLVKERLPGGTTVAQGQLEGTQHFSDGAADGTVSSVISRLRDRKSVV